MHRVSTYSHVPWVGSVGCVGQWRRGEDRGVCAGVGSHSPDFDMSYMVWLYAVDEPQVHPLTYFALHEVKLVPDTVAVEPAPKNFPRYIPPPFCQCEIHNGSKRVTMIDGGS